MRGGSEQVEVEEERIVTDVDTRGGEESLIFFDDGASDDASKSCFLDDDPSSFVD